MHDQATLVFGDPAPAALVADDGLRPELRRYQVGRLVGAGGMGHVYEAWDTLLERPVALKVMRADVSAGERRRFRREALLGARLLHPGLVRVYDMGQGGTGEAEWIAMEFLPGTDLLRLLDGARARGHALGWPRHLRRAQPRPRRKLRRSRRRRRFPHQNGRRLKPRHRRARCRPRRPWRKHQPADLSHR